MSASTSMIHQKHKCAPLPMAATADKHLLYEASVQDADTEINFVRRVFRSRHGRSFRNLREDFSGTSMVSCDWARRHPDNRSWGVDLDKETLEWARVHRAKGLGRAAERVSLVQGDVLTTELPTPDAILAFNFSYSVFKTREQLLAYFKKSYDRLEQGGMFTVDIFGGTESVTVKKDTRVIAKSKCPNGMIIPKFTYIWHQADYNPVTNEILCHIHFTFPDGSKMMKAFTYDWRLWTLPEIRELMDEAGFSTADTYIHDFDDDGESDDIWRKRTKYENCQGWIAYVVGWK